LLIADYDRRGTGKRLMLEGVLQVNSPFPGWRGSSYPHTNTSASDALTN
jgi:hypothetical protein